MVGGEGQGGGGSVDVWRYLSPRAIPEKWPWSDEPTTSTHQKAAWLWLPLLRNRYINFYHVGK
jgi:hypothetical protein